MGRSELVIIIPAYNEAKTITQVVRSLKPYADVIVVDDCSRDETRAEALAAGANVFSHSVNQGYDGALNTGFLKAQGLGYRYLITFDADGQHDALWVQQFLDALKAGSDVVVGIRSQHARLFEKIFAFYTRWRFGLQDPLCGMKAYRIEVYQERGFFDSYHSIGTELTLYALYHKKKLTQIPIPIKAREDQPRFGRCWRANYKIFRAMLLSLFIK